MLYFLDDTMETGWAVRISDDDEDCGDDHKELGSQNGA
jgi:hypothetical protein